MLSEDADVCWAPVSSNVAAYRAGARALRHGAESVHLLDATLAPAGALLRFRFGVPVSATVGSRAVTGNPARAVLTVAAIDRLDQAFTAEPFVTARLRRRAPRVPVAAVAPGAVPLPEPSPARLRRVARLLDGMLPARLVVGLPWTDDRDHMRWYRDAVAPLLAGNPVCLLFGAPSRRDARLIFGVRGLRETYRVLTGKIDADTVAAVARCVDAFVLPGDARPMHITQDLVLAMAASGAPLVAGGGVRSAELEHERNAFVATAADPMSLVSTLNQLLALPAAQRHELGRDFAAATLTDHTWQPAARLHGERFAALVGRPEIPAALRAA